MGGEDVYDLFVTPSRPTVDNSSGYEEAHNAKLRSTGSGRDDPED